MINKHTFSYSGFEGGRKVFLVKCKNTGGSFCTSLWNKGKAKRQICPCCNLEVKNE